MNIASLPVVDKSDPSRASHMLLFSELQGVRQSGDWLRAYCPVHGGDHQRSLSIHVNSGKGQCFCCQANVQVMDLHPSSSYSGSRSSSHRSSAPGSLPSAPVSPSWSWQQEERALLLSLFESGELDLSRPSAWNARAYLASRHIPLDVAHTAGVGYLAPQMVQQYQTKLLQRWADRLLFPLVSFEQDIQMQGFAGRLITGWQACADENAHKAFLDEQGLGRWLKTRPAGWFWTPPPQPLATLILVEGPFDRLALLASGLESHEVLALVGTSLGMVFPAKWQQWVAGGTILLALDDDSSGQDAAKLLLKQLAMINGIKVERCFPASMGKDWSERWSRLGQEGLESLYAHLALLAHRL